MDNGAPTWGIPGPVFLVVYVMLAVTALALPHILVARSARSTGRGSNRHVPDRDAPDRGVSAEQLAVLTAGPRRAVEVSVARLVELGRLRISRDRVLSPAVAAEAGIRDGQGGVVRGTGPGGPEESDLDAAVLHAVGPGARLHRVVSGVERTHTVTEITEQLVARGLLHDPVRLRARRRLGRIVLALVVVLGLARIAAGIAHGAATVLLIVFMVLFASLSVGFLRVGVHRLTARGVATVGELATAIRSHDQDGDLPGGRRSSTFVPLALAGAAGLVAIGGLAAFPDPEVGMLLASAAPYAGAGGSSCGSSCGGSSCGSSCGGGSSCGSSCGGGGGCGG